ncbi:MAG TPA: CDP-alcohol phosphatidyltransferase family protein [Longimicrobiaceae bacterium]|nr:CDP-alcohol phosphatidyltransferase family protein [Longimicrobiaceae bacterium]
MTTPITRGDRARAYAVHVYTASGVVLAFLAAAETCAPEPDPRRVFLWLALAVLLDATDGPLARRWKTKTNAPRVDGRTIDDIVDYLTFTFLPLLLVWRMGWVPEPGWPWVAPALVASLFGFANAGAKDEGGGFFLGFPSYWNVAAFYAGPLHAQLGPWPVAALLLALALLTVAPVRFVYPNLAPPPWRVPVLLGAVAWLAVLLAMLPDYPRTPGWLLWASLLYPAFYTAVSLRLDREARRRGG